MTATWNFVSEGDKMRELLVKKWKRKKKKREKEKRKIIDHLIGLKRARNFRAVLQCFLAKLNENWQGWSVESFNRLTRSEERSTISKNCV